MAESRSICAPKSCSITTSLSGALCRCSRGKGADGNACVNCHTTHTIFKLIEPDKQGRFTDEQLRENYRSALKVVDMANPENSLIIRKPTGDASQEGLIGSKKTPHGGGMRWNGLTDPAVQTVMEWINGAKSATPK